jgi:transposase
MIHHIKSLYADGEGLTIRAIAQQLNISRNTVRKYLRLDEAEISRRQDDRSRSKRLDDQRDFIVHLLQTYPRLSAVKVLRKLKAKHGDPGVSDRTVRRYVEVLRESVAVKQARYYAPVLDMVPGVQCQVDPGELRSVLIGGVETVVYFVVFVLSYSRLMHVALSDRPIDTQTFIGMHDAAFRAFGGCPEECVYDQTKLVVVREEYRELVLNERFHAYATRAGIGIRVCEGFDPESKGKVEAGVKYVKNDALYGETFADWTALEAHVMEWLDTVANLRCHGTTGRVPQAHYEAEERHHMQPYLSPDMVHSSDPETVTRKVDKTGLIAWQGNKYSVPMAYQRGRVGIRAAGGLLRIMELECGDEIAHHSVCLEKGRVIRNTDHYRDRRQQIRDYEALIHEHIGSAYGPRLCALLKTTSPKIYKDQLAGARRILRQHGALSDTLLAHLLDRPRLTATGLRDYLAAYASQVGRLKAPATLPMAAHDSALRRYAGLAAKEGCHEFH